MQAIPGTRSPLAWLGGKSRLAATILPLAPDHTCYAEVFAGAAWLLFKKPESKAEVINDINVDLVTLYRVLQHHLEEFVRYFKWVLVSRDEFARLHRVDPGTLTDIQRAARFFYMQKAGFSGKVNSRTFGISTGQPPRLNLLRLEEELSAAHLRLSRVYIENLPFLDLIDRYDRAGTWFYADPPYYGCEDDYGRGLFKRADFEVLAERLGRLKGKVLVSINDRPEIRKAFSGFRIKPVETTYSVGSAKRGGMVRELIITNYPV